LIIQNHTPTGELSEFIKEFVYLKNDQTEKLAVTSIDDACYDFMFVEKGTVRVDYGDSHYVTTNLKAYTHQFKPPTKFTFENQADYFTIKTQPWANALFFPYKIPHDIVDLRETYGDSIIKLHQEIFNAGTFQEKIHVSNHFFTGLKLEIKEHFYLVKDICTKIYGSKGMITVNELSEIFNMDRQSLNKTFLEYVNYTLKKFIIFVRILSATKYKMNNPSIPFTTIAYDYGYFDQAHFNNDFKRINGVSPSKLFKELPLFLQRHKK
jgi:AraC-like DNA-binding protein